MRYKCNNCGSIYTLQDTNDIVVLSDAILCKRCDYDRRPVDNQCVEIVDGESLENESCE
jgi:DNA-directed RNA polymerase subunit RPC12/RpoP